MATDALPTRRAGVMAVACLSAVFGIGLIAAPPVALANSPSTVDLGKASPFAVLAGEPVRNSGPTAITGDVGVYPWPTVAGLPDGTVSGTTYRADKTAIAAKAALVAAYYDAAGRASTATRATLGGTSLAPGIYNAGTEPLTLAGHLVLDAAGNPDAVWIFQTSVDLATAAGSAITLANGAQGCNVFWQIGGSASLGTGSTLFGTVMAAGSITLGNSVTLAGRALARDGSVTLLNNIVTGPGCLAPSGHATGPGTPARTPATAAFVVPTGSGAPRATEPASGIGSYALLITLIVLVIAAVSMGGVPDRKRVRNAR